MKTCVWLVKNDHENSSYEQCEAPAHFKTDDGRWLCAEHWDEFCSMQNATTAPPPPNVYPARKDNKWAWDNEWQTWLLTP